MALGPGVTRRRHPLALRARRARDGHRRLGLGRPAPPPGAGRRSSATSAGSSGRPTRPTCPYSQIERLVNLGELPPTGFQVACFPLKIVGGERGAGAGRGRSSRTSCRGRASPRQRPEVPPLQIRPLRPRACSPPAVHPRRPQPVALCRREVVLETERHAAAISPSGPRADLAQSVLEGSVRLLVGAAVLRHRHAVELDLQVAQRVLDDRAVGVRDDPEPQPGLLGGAQRGHGVRERLPALHRARERLAVAVVPAVAALAGPLGEAVGQHLAVAAVVALEALELKLLPARAQLAAGRRLPLVAPRDLVQERGGAALPVDQRAVAVECRDSEPVPYLHLGTCPCWIRCKTT